MTSLNMSDSEYEHTTVVRQQPKKKAQTSKQKSCETNSRSDSEYEHAIVVQQQPKKKAQTKRKSSETSSSGSKRKLSPAPNVTEDLFGLETGASTPATSGGLTSSLISRVANGKVRRTATLTGPYYVEVKVYNTTEAASSRPDERWKKALVTLKAQLGTDSPQWDILQLFMRRTHELFDESEAVFFSDSINFK